MCLDIVQRAMYKLSSLIGKIKISFSVIDDYILALAWGCKRMGRCWSFDPHLCFSRSLHSP